MCEKGCKCSNLRTPLDGAEREDINSLLLERKGKSESPEAETFAGQTFGSQRYSEISTDQKLLNGGANDGKSILEQLTVQSHDLQWTYLNSD